MQNLPCNHGIVLHLYIQFNRVSHNFVFICLQGVLSITSKSREEPNYEVEITGFGGRCHTGSVARGDCWCPFSDIFWKFSVVFLAACLDFSTV